MIHLVLLLGLMQLPTKCLFVDEVDKGWQPCVHLISPTSATVTVDEPTDVSAVMKPSKEPPNGPECLTWPCGHKFTAWCHHVEGAGDIPYFEQCEDHPPLVWTCNDESRFLLESVDGTKHCVKFQ